MYVCTYAQCTCALLYVFITTVPPSITAVPPVPAPGSSTSADSVGGAVGGTVVFVVILLVVVGVVMWKLS